MKPMVLLTPPAHSRTRQPLLRDPSETPRGGGDNSNSCYFPGCRKDTNCNCEMCLDSINATRDLLPFSSNSPFGSDMTTTTTTTSSPPLSPQVGSTLTNPLTPLTKSTAKYRPSKKKKSVVEGKGRFGVWAGVLLLAVVLGFGLIWGLDLVVLGEYGPRLTAETVREVAEECGRVFEGDFKGKMAFLRERIERFVGSGVSDCGAADSRWELNQEGQFLFQWRCVMYKSMAERITVWGSPLRTTGLLTTGSSQRSLTLLSGKIIEWSDGRLLSTMRSNNSSSWTYQKWSSAALQLEPNTWILDYERSAIFQQPGLVPATWDILTTFASKKLKRLKRFRLGQLVDDALFGYGYGGQKKRTPIPPS